jgi:hypothetical protein
MRLAPHRRTCSGQRYAVPTAPAFAHKLHSLQPLSVTESGRYNTRVDAVRRESLLPQVKIL